MSDLSSIVDDLRLVYANFWSGTRPCLCTEDHMYPNVIVIDDLNIVCSAHLWLDKRAFYQREFVRVGGLMPPTESIAKTTLNAEAAAIGSRLKKWKIADKLSHKNPFWEPPQILWDDVSGTRFIPGKLAMELAYVLFRERQDNDVHRAEHPVMLLTKSDLINVMFRDYDLYRDMLTLPPLLIIGDNNDKRMDMLEVVTPIYSREYGTCFVFAMQGG